MSWLPQIDLESCIGCGDCVEVCPVSALAMRDDGLPFVAEPEACTYCSWCEGICPTEAIALPYQIILSES